MDDERIVELFFERSAQAIKSLSEKYERVFMKVSMNALGSAPDAEECVNDAYLGVWNAIPPARPNPLLAYVCRIVRNISINRFNSKFFGRGKSNYSLCLDELAEVVPAEGSAEDAAVGHELTAYIEAFLRGRPEIDRLLFVRRYFYMDTCEDISEASGLGAGAIRTRLFRMRADLKAYFIGKGVEI